MFADLLRRLTDTRPGRLPDPDVRLALAALLVRIARADGVYAPAEVERIDRTLMARHRLSPFEAAALRREAEELETAAPDTVRFTRAIKEGVALDDRIAVIEAMWDVALADGRRDNSESNQLRLMADLLGINDLDSNLARQRVEERRG